MPGARDAARREPPSPTTVDRGWPPRSPPTTPTAWCSSACSRARRSSSPTWRARSATSTSRSRSSPSPATRPTPAACASCTTSTSTSPGATSCWWRTSSTPASPLGYLVKHLEAQGPRRVDVCTLLDRPARRILPVTVRYVGVEIPDVFVLGYGLHRADLYRNVPRVVDRRSRAWSRPRPTPTSRRSTRG